MKKTTIIIAAVLLTLALCGTIYAKYMKGFTVVTTTEDTVVIKDKNDVEISVTTKKAGKYKAGDKVKYDDTKKKISRDGRVDYSGGC